MSNMVTVLNDFITWIKDCAAEKEEMDAIGFSKRVNAGEGPSSGAPIRNPSNSEYDDTEICGYQYR